MLTWAVDPLEESNGMLLVMSVLSKKTLAISEAKVGSDFLTWFKLMMVGWLGLISRVKSFIGSIWGVGPPPC